MNATTKIESGNGFVPKSDLVVAPRLYRLIGNLMLALALVGFPLVASLAQLLQFEPGLLSIAYRIAVMVLAGVLILWSLGRGRYRIDLLIAFFFVLYSIRILFDLNSLTFPNIENDALFFVAVVLVPTLAMGGVRDWFSEEIFLRLTLIIGGIGGLLVTAALAGNGITTKLPQDFVDRATLNFLNPISIGYHGLFIATAAIIVLATYPRKAWLAPCLVNIALGGYLLVESSSRGPFVALFLGLLLTGVADRRAHSTYLVGGLFAAGVIAYLGVPEGIVTRFQNIGDVSTRDRLDAVQYSIDATLDNPLFGYAYVEPITGLYPHNLIVEAGLAIGLIGVALMLWMQISLLLNAWRHARRGEWAVPFLAAAMFANAWISGAIWGSALFFMLLWLLREVPQRQADAVRAAHDGSV